MHKITYDISTKSNNNLADLPRVDSDSNISESQKCSICKLAFKDQKCFTLKHCQHKFHQKCLNVYFKCLIEQNAFPLGCPNNMCSNKTLKEDLRHIISDNDMQQYYKDTYNMKKSDINKGIYWCLTPGCAHVFNYKKGSKMNPKNQCP